MDLREKFYKKMRLFKSDLINLAHKKKHLALIALLGWIVFYGMSVLGYPYIILKDIALLLSLYLVINSVVYFFDHSFFGKVNSWILTFLISLNYINITEDSFHFLEQNEISIGDVSFSFFNLFVAAMALSLISWGALLLSTLLQFLIKSQKRLTKTQAIMTLKIMRIVLLIIGFFVWIKIVGVDITSFAIFGGAIALGLGFGLQKIFSNLVSGFLILLDDSIKVGDVIAVDDTYGRVEKLNTRYISITTRDGKKHLIPNEMLITEKIENWSFKNTRVRNHVKITVGYDSDLKLVKKILLQAAKKADDRILQDPEPRCNLTNFGDSAVEFDLLVWVSDPENGFAAVKDKLLFYIWDAFKKNDISIPYPQRDVHLIKSEAPKA